MSTEIPVNGLHGPKRYQAEPIHFASGIAFRPARSAQLDEADLRIIDTLVADGRANSRSMRSVTGLTEETIAARIRNLIDRRVIGVSAIFDWSAAGYLWDMYLTVECGDGPIRPVIDELAQLEEVISIYTVFGPVDLVAHVLCKDRESMLSLISSRLTQIGGIRNLDVFLTLDTVKFSHQFAWVPVAPTPLTFPAPVVDLNELDHSIISAIVKNGRVSNREIGRELGVADGTVRAHLHRLESSGLLRVCAQVHPLTSGMVKARAFVGISVHGADTAALATELAGIAEIVSISLTSGRYELFCYVMARSRSRLIQLVADEIRPLDGVRSTETWEVIDGAKHASHWARW
jgi:DNA-binding Lrp family transcriptional regulator